MLNTTTDNSFLRKNFIHFMHSIFSDSLYVLTNANNYFCDGDELIISFEQIMFSFKK